MFSRNQLSDFFFQTTLCFSVTELMNKLAHEKCLVDMDVFFAKMKLQNLQRPTVVEEQMWVFTCLFYWYVAGKFDIKCDWDPTEILGFPFSANQLLTMLHLLRDAIVKVSMAVANAMIWSSQTAPLPALPCNFIDFLMFFFDICFIIFGQTFWFSNRDLKFF